MNNKKQLFGNIGIILFFIITIVVVFLTHRAVPFMMDDLWYSTILSDDTPLRSLSDVINAQIWHYNNWGGRSMAHGLLQLILMQGELFADILNTLVTILLAWEIYLFAKEISGEKSTNAVLTVTMIIGTLHGLNANWQMSMYWQSGSANYLYITVFILFFIRCYVRELVSEAPVPFKGIIFWIVPLAVITGWSNENMGPTAWLVSLFVILYLRKNKKPIKVWMILGNVFCLVGSAMCILAPGNFVRSAEAHEERGILWTLYLRCYSEFRGAFDYLYPTLIVFLFLWIIYVISKKNVEKNEEETGLISAGFNLQTGILFAAAVIACGAMILSPHFPDRSTFGCMVLLITAVVAFSNRIIEANKKNGLYLLAPGILIWLHGMFWLMEYLGMSWGWIK